MYNFQLDFCSHDRRNVAACLDFHVFLHILYFKSSFKLSVSYFFSCVKWGFLERIDNFTFSLYVFKVRLCSLLLILSCILVRLKTSSDLTFTIIGNHACSTVEKRRCLVKFGISSSKTIYRKRKKRKQRLQTPRQPFPYQFECHAVFQIYLFP